MGPIVSQPVANNARIRIYNMTLFIDLDGVLADFDKSAAGQMGTDNISKYEFVWGTKKFWDKINEDPEFFANLDPMSDYWELWGAVAPLDPTILTALPKTDAYRVEQQKRQWVADYIGDSVPVICCLTKDKPNFCLPGDVLIDDRAINREAWLAAGGTYIIHTSAARSIAALEALGII